MSRHQLATQIPLPGQLEALIHQESFDSSQDIRFCYHLHWQIMPVTEAKTEDQNRFKPTDVSGRLPSLQHGCHRT